MAPYELNYEDAASPGESSGTWEYPTIAQAVGELQRMLKEWNAPRPMEPGVIHYRRLEPISLYKVGGNGGPRGGPTSLTLLWSSSRGWQFKELTKEESRVIGKPSDFGNRREIPGQTYACPVEGCGYVAPSVVTRDAHHHAAHEPRRGYPAMLKED